MELLKEGRRFSLSHVFPTYLKRTGMKFLEEIFICLSSQPEGAGMRLLEEKCLFSCLLYLSRRSRMKLLEMTFSSLLYSSRRDRSETSGGEIPFSCLLY